MTKFFVDEYYMAAILHFMTYDSVIGDPEKTIERFKDYTKRRDVVVIIFKISFCVFFAACAIASVCDIAIRHGW